MKRLFINAKILTLKEEEDQPLVGAALAVEEGKILHVEPTSRLDADHYDEVIDMSGKVIMPGFINTHSHAAMSLLRGYSDDLPLKAWLENKIWPMEARFGPEQVKWGSSLAVLEMIKGGITCFADMYDYMDQVAEVVRDSGIRASLCRGAIGLCSEQEQKQKFDEALRFAREWDGKADGRITTMMAPHSPYTCPPNFISRFVEGAAELNVPLHTHMSETEAEVLLNVEQYGARPVEHLHQLGVFDRRALVAHAVHLTPAELNMLYEHDVKVSHNPGSNLKLGSGIAPIPTMIQLGIRPSLGTDSAASNNNLDLLEEARLATLVQKGFNQDPLAIPALTALQMGTSYGAEALFIENTVGSLEPGKQADFISVDLTGPHMQPPHNILSHLVYSASREDVKDLYVDGEPLMRDRECLTVDEERIKYYSVETFKKIS